MPRSRTSPGIIFRPASARRNQPPTCSTPRRVRALSPTWMRISTRSSNRPTAPARSPSLSFSKNSSIVSTAPIARMLAERADRAATAGDRHPAVDLQDDLRRARPAVVGRGERRGVRAGVADRDEVTAPERRQEMLAEVVRGLADRAVDARRLEPRLGDVSAAAAAAGAGLDRPAERRQRGDLV